MYKYIIFILFIIITFVFICKLLFIEKFSNFNCDLIPNSDTCTIKIKGDDGEKGEKGSEGYKGMKGAKGKKGLSGSMGIDGKEIPNIKFKEFNKEESLLGNYYSYDSNADTKTIYLNKGPKGIRAIIPPLSLIYNDLKNITVNETDENSSMEPIRIDLRSVKGRKGDRGKDGECAKGKTGFKGDQGREGDPGPPGEDGQDGPQGPNGDDGPTQKNVEYNRVSSKTYCFNKGGSKPLCISADTYQDYYDSIQDIDNYSFVPTEVVKTGSTQLNDEPSEDSPLNEQCIECPCGKINNGSGECVNDDTNLVIFNKNDECYTFKRDLDLYNHDKDNWNDKVTKIHIPPGVKITSHPHTHEKWTECEEHNNTGNEVMIQTLRDGITYIGYNKVCTNFPKPPPPPPPPPPEESPPAEEKWVDEGLIKATYPYLDYEGGYYDHNRWRDNTWLVSDNNRLIIIYKTNLIYDGENDGEKSEIIIGDKKYVRKLTNNEIHDRDDIDISFSDKKTRNDEWIQGEEYNFQVYHKG